LIELRRFERWGGLPFAGGYADQPYHWLREVEAAMIGRQRRLVARAINKAREGADATVNAV